MGSERRIDTGFEADDQTSLNESVARGALFYCPNAPRCSAKYLRYNYFMAHISGDRCITKRRASSAKEYVLKTYVEKFSSTPHEQNLTQSDRRHYKIHLEHMEIVVLEAITYPRAAYNIGNPARINYRIQGWALPTRKQATMYSMDQVNFAKLLFLQGQETNKKKTPEEAELLMPDSINPRTKQLFSANEWLTSDQFK